jgi:serine/threonine protein kinase
MADSNSKNRENDFEDALRQFIDSQMRGEKPDIEEFINQYPEFEDQIRQNVQSFHKIDSLFDTLVQSGEGDFVNITMREDLIGQKIGCLEIVEMIGKGGMGIVYLARDSKLDRFVAIKSMPAEMQASSTARTRFMREAKLLASLSHPNIGVIHDIIEQTEGSAYLVLEYIPGETLAERMAREPLQLKDALSIGLQIAEAVCAAHETGVIHRDLKPSNIKITPDGRVKVLDFGLAKTSIRKDAGNEPTVTQEGRLMGTPAYMSPEQARGQATDRRTDIWSFGCLLYEMLTCRLPFEGETTTDILARIIEREPDWSLLPQTTPSNIRVLLWRCLAKDPRRRLQHIGDAVIEIDETLNVPTDKPRISEPVTKVIWWRRWWWTIAFSLAGIIIGIIVASTFLSEPAGPSPSTVASVITLPEDQVLGFFQATTFGIRRPAFALSPDGSRLVYVARVGATTQLFERMMNQYEVRPIPGTHGTSSPFFSPDGQSVGFFVKEQLKTVSLHGGEPVILCNAGLSSSGSWSDDGMIYFCRAGSLFSVSSAGGGPEDLGIESELIGSYPQVLPGGKGVLISSSVGAELVFLETMEKKILVKDVLYARYVPTGYLVYVRAGALEAVPFSLATLKETGPRVPIINNVLSDSVYGSAQFAFSNDGTLVYVPGRDTGKTIPVWVDRHGKEELLEMPTLCYGTPKLSPDGQRLVIVVRELQSNMYVYDIATGMGTKLTQEGDNIVPVWTPDGKTVVFSCRRENEEQWNLFWAPADGSSKAEPLFQKRQGLFPCSGYHDGKRLMVRSSDLGICILSVDEPHELESVFRPDFATFQEALSPDGKYIAYASNKEGDFHVYVRPYPEWENWEKRISLDFGEEPIWSNNCDELFYRNRDKWMVVPISTEPEFKAGTPKMIFKGPYINVAGFSYDVAPDGQRFLVLKPQYDDSKVRVLHVVTNWFEELKRFAPLGKE